MNKTLVIFLTIFLVTGIALNLYADGQEKVPELEKTLVKLKYVQPEDLAHILQGYSSRYGRINFNDKLNVITISDTPEIVEKMLSIIKEIDVKPVDMLFTIDLIIGTMNSKDVLSSTKLGTNIPDAKLESDPLIKELKNILGYKHYFKVDSTFLRIQDGGRSEQRIGGPGLDLVLELAPRYVKEKKEGAIQLSRLELGQYKGVMKDGKRLYTRLILTPLTLKSGERTVVGVSKLDGGDNALILIISGKVIE